MVRGCLGTLATVKPRPSTYVLLVYQKAPEAKQCLVKMQEEVCGQTWLTSDLFRLHSGSPVWFLQNVFKMVVVVIRFLENPKTD